MNKIDWNNGFIGVDGIKRSKKSIERWYLRELFVRSKSNPIIYNSLGTYYGRIYSWLITLEKKQTLDLWVNILPA